MSIIAKITGFFHKKPQDLEKDGQLKNQNYLGKFVKQNNIIIGESIAINGKRIIIKNLESIFSIPVEALLNNTDTIVVGNFDREESLNLGKVWIERKDVMKFDEKGMLIK